jgi:hypothetical protein
MNTEMHGKKITAVYWPDTNDETGRCLVSGAECGDLHLSATYHGDHDEFWIVQTKNGEEVARHNPKFAETIQWA